MTDDTKMTEDDLLQIVTAAENDAISHSDDLRTLNKYFMERYLVMPYGDEQEGRSSVVSTDAQDTVQSDMPSLARTFLGPNDIMSFKPSSAKPADIQEAEDKTRYINFLIREQKGSYKTQHGTLKTLEIEKIGVQKYFYEEVKEVKELTLKGFDELQWVEVIADLEDGADEVVRTDINGEKKGDLDRALGPDDEVTFKITRVKKKYVISGVPNENFLISRNAESKDTADLVGDRGTISKGDLIAMDIDGLTVDAIKDMPPAPKHVTNASEGMKHTRYRGQGGVAHQSEITAWQNQLVEFSDLYMRIDFDDDNILERRRIYKVGGKIAINEYFPIVPYAIGSAVLEPYTVIGRSRVELVVHGAWVKTVLERQMLDNTYSSANGRVVVNDKMTNLDDLSVVRLNGIVRTTDPLPANAVAELNTKFIAPEIQQVIQYMDFKRTQSMGGYMQNQGLDDDKFNNETATRFEGLEDSSTAKIELVARNIAETLYTELYEGLAQLVAHTQDFETEIMVLGRPLRIDPRKWRFDHEVESQVGLGAGDDDKILENMAVISNIQDKEKAQGSTLVDEKKRYNTYARSVKALGIRRVDEFFNDPEDPKETLRADLEKALDILEQQGEMIEQLSQRNPLAEAEDVKKDKEFTLKQAELEQKDSSQNKDRVADLIEHREEMNLEYDKLQLEHDVDIEGQGTDDRPPAAI